MAKASKILIIEDEMAMARALVLKLKRAGHEAQIACDGEEALEILSKESFDLLLLDLMMPKIDGFGVLESLEKKRKVPPIIIISNLSQEKDVSKAMDMGVEDYLVKSNNTLGAIVERVEKALSRKRP